MLKTCQLNKANNSKIILYNHYSQPFQPKKQFSNKNTFYLSDKNIYDWDSNALNTYEVEKDPKTIAIAAKKDPLPPKFLYESDDKKYTGSKTTRETKKNGVTYHMGSDIFHFDDKGKIQPPPRRVIRKYANQESQPAEYVIRPAIKKSNQQTAISEKNPFNFNN